MQTEDVITKVYGELHEMLGDHREFKREVLERLSGLENDVKNASGAGAAKFCAVISALSGIVAFLSSLGIKLSAFVPQGGDVL